MSYSEQPGGTYPPPSREYGDSQYPQPPATEYPPPPGEEDDRIRAYNSRVSQVTSNVTLPSISPYEPPYAPPLPNGYVDPRASYRPEPYHHGMGQQYDPRGYQGDYARPPPPGHMQYQNTAPRQRTAIACRYCRRRKIRCSGFEDNPTGKCQNCTRFQQECIFTPVSSQAQAFVPAHAAYPHMRPQLGPDGRPRMVVNTYGQPQQLYGAHGQPLGPMPQQGPPGGLPPPQVAYPDYPLPSPTATYKGYPDDRSEMSRKRPHGEPQPSLLPPPVPGQTAYARQDTGRRAPVDEEGLRLPTVTPILAQANAAYSPGSATAVTPNSLLRTEQLPPLARTPPTRGSAERVDPMALGNIMDRHPDSDVDRSMLNRLGRK